MERSIVTLKRLFSKDIKTDSKQYMIDCLESEDRLVKQKNIRKKNHLDM